MPFAELADVKLHYRFDGDESLPVLVLSNSLGTSLDMWQPQIACADAAFPGAALRHARPRAVVRHRGPYSIAQLGGDVIALLDHLGLQRVHFCGLSMGGITGMWLGVHHGDRLRQADPVQYGGLYRAARELDQPCCRGRA